MAEILAEPAGSVRKSQTLVVPAFALAPPQYVLAGAQ